MIPTLNPLTPGTPHVNHKEAATGVLFSVPDRGRNSGAVTSRLLEPRHMPGVSPAHSVPHAGSRQRSPAHSEVRRQSRVRCGLVWVSVLHPHPHLLQGPQRGQRGCTWCRSILFIQWELEEEFFKHCDPCITHKTNKSHENLQCQLARP